MTWRPLRGHEPRDPGPPAPDTDAHVVGAHPRNRAEDPEIGRRLRLRRRAIVIGLSTLFAAGGIGALVGGGGALQVRRLRSEAAVLGAEVERQEAVVLALRDSVDRLEEGSLETERLAREQLGMVRPGEIDFLLPRQPRESSAESAE